MVAVRLQRNARGAHALVAQVRRGFLLADLPAPPALSVCTTCEGAEIDRTALGRDEARVDEEEQVREGGAEVRAVDGTVAGRFGRIDIFTPPAVQLDGLFVRYVRKADW